MEDDVFRLCDRCGGLGLNCTTFLDRMKFRNECIYCERQAKAFKNQKENKENFI